MLAPSPFFFGTEKSRLFGWWHPAKTDSSADIGLLICSPFGFEEVCVHRSLRHLATAAACAGIPVVRFDYAGCGNSSGDEFEPDMLACWLESIHEAAETLKRRAGVSRICLVGLRLGATLATLAALDRDDVEVLVAIAPIVQGRLWLRELRILAQAGANGVPPPAEDIGLIEAAGFVLTKETAAAISEIDLRELPTPPAKRVLLVGRDDMPASPQWGELLAKLGAEVLVGGWSGYRDMMLDPQKSIIPVEMLDGIVQTLEDWTASPRSGERMQFVPSDVRMESRDETFNAGAFRESTVLIDTETSSLFGVLTQGGGTDSGILLVNSGSVHHIGPNRLWVRLARQWAQRGLLVLRLDLSGIGDSSPRQGAEENVVYSAEAMKDIESALQYMQNQLGIKDCKLLGLCSGAYHGFKAAVAGQPLSAVIMINPLTFFWTLGTPLDEGIKDYEVVSQSAGYSKQIFTLEPWRKLFNGQLDLGYILRFVVRRLWTSLVPHLRMLARLLRIPMANDLGRELSIASQNGVQQRFVFAVGEPGFELLKTQAEARLDELLEKKEVTIDFIPDADHTFTRLQARERLIVTLNRLIFVDGCVLQ